MAVKYKQLCVKCKKSYVLVSYKDRFPVCFDCEKASLEGTIKSPKMKKLFDIPKDLYKKSGFLRSIKINYLRYGSLTDKQIEYFKKTVANLKKDK